MNYQGVQTGRGFIEHTSITAVLTYSTLHEDRLDRSLIAYFVLKQSILQDLGKVSSDLGGRS